MTESKVNSQKVFQQLSRKSANKINLNAIKLSCIQLISCCIRMYIYFSPKQLRPCSLIDYHLDANLILVLSNFRINSEIYGDQYS